MKNRQYSLKVFETSIGEEDRFIEFFETNYPLFKEHLILIQGEMSDRIRQFLNEKSLKYLNNISLPKGRPGKSLERELQRQSEGELAKENQALKERLRLMEEELERLRERELTKKRRSIVIEKMIRSGFELDAPGDLLLLKRVNSGATLRAAGNIIALDIVEGTLHSEGDFMIISRSPKAKIFFNDLIVKGKLLKHRLNLIRFKGDEIEVKALR